MENDLPLGATVAPDGLLRFNLWAPSASQARVHIVEPEDQMVPMVPRRRGYYVATVHGLGGGTLYRYRLDDRIELPDPASRSQPNGVHGPSQVLELSFGWTDESWTGIPLQEYIIYELHVGTFTNEGTFDGAAAHLRDLRGLGITAVELMPVAQFPGARNWGYDGVYPFAVQDTYGGPQGLMRLVNACHQEGLAVVLDVVYNHLGPEGNYTGEFGPYYTDLYKTPWGPALNFEGPFSDEVRRFFIENALYWMTEFHIDALRLDAVHAILDRTALTFLEELTETVTAEAKRLNRSMYLIAESSDNDARLVRRREKGGCGMDAQWNDDFHHAVHTLLTGERTGYYADFGTVSHLEKALRDGFVYSGEFSEYRLRRHGASSRDIAAHRLIVGSQNHDQVGNRMNGERLGSLLTFEGTKLAAGVVVLSPYIPLLFMGEEYGETAPFLYFVDHSDPALIRAVRKGRREEFTAFAWPGKPPDPQAERTFLRSKLDHELRNQGHHSVIGSFYKELLRLRKTLPALTDPDKERQEVGADETEKVIWARRWHGDAEAFLAFNFGESSFSALLPVPAGSWDRVLDSSEERWLGKGSETSEHLESTGCVSLELNPHSLVVLARVERV